MPCRSPVPSPGRSISMPSRTAAVKTGPVQGRGGASWKQPQAEGNCTQVGCRETIPPAWRREAMWGRSRRRAAAPNISEALCRPVRSGERAKERDAQSPTEIGAVLGPGAAGPE
jgi:hypothetical protein